MARRSTFDPFARDRACYPHEVTAHDKFGELMYSRKIPAGADLRLEFERECQRLAAEGWTMEEPFKASTFVSRGVDRWCVSLHQDRSYKGPPARLTGD